MYRYVDRPVGDVGEPHRFLLASMRVWVDCARSGRCPCAVLAGGFAGQGAPAAAADFGMAMAALDRDGLGRLAFSPLGHGCVAEDEARLLALFDAGLSGDSPQVRRIAATLVNEEAAPRLATAIEWVGMHLTGGIFETRD